MNGVDLTAGGQVLGPLTSGKISSGRTFTSADSDAKVAVIDSGYAKSNGLTVGSAVTLGNTSGTGTNFDVVGIVTEPPGATPADVYVPLQQAQSLSGSSGKVNTIYVVASDSSAISGVSGEIKQVLPSATVTTSSDLANEVTGSLSSAASLANNLGKWLAIAVLAAAFLLASLFTMSAVSRRVREFGTLKALGWRSRRVVGQVMGEAIACGIAGGIIGVGLGLAGAKLVSSFAPPLTASVGLTTGSATPGGARQFGAGNFGGGGAGGGGAGGGFPGGGFSRTAAAASHSVAVHLHGAGDTRRDRARRRTRGGRRSHRGDIRWLAGRTAASSGCAQPGRVTAVEIRSSPLRHGGFRGVVPPDRHRRSRTGHAPGEEVMYKLTGVTKHYQKGRQAVAALQGVDLVIDDGEWLAIQGPTGHGKTTLLQLLGGLDRATSGSVELDGTDWRAAREPGHDGGCASRSASSSRRST